MKMPHRPLARICLHTLAGIFTPLCLTLFDWPMRQTLTPTNILLVYLLGVFFLALRLGLWSSFVASISSAAAFAYFFAPPIFSFAIADQENLIGLVVMLIVGAITSQQAADTRFQSQLAARREKRVTALYELSKELAEAPLEKQIIEISVRHIHSEFNTRNTILLPDADGKLIYPADMPFAESCRHADLVAANHVFLQQTWPDKQPPNTGLASTQYMALTGSTGPIGVLVLEGTNAGQFIQQEQQQLLETIMNQIVHTLERAALAETARESNSKMQAESLRNSLLSSISHDLRTPLATIIGAASTLDADFERLNAEARRNLVKAIQGEAYRMSDLTTKILQMARLEAGEVVLNRQWYEAEEIIGSALRRLENNLTQRHININMAHSQTLIFVDAVLLQQVLINLLENADKYSATDLPIDISLGVETGNLLISVADRGPGIPSALQEKIFAKFYQVHAESAQSGVGLGLSICRAIVEAHQGSIAVENRCGGGAVFKLRLPVPACPPAIDPEEQRFTSCL